MAFANAMHFDYVEDSVTNSILLPQEITPLASMNNNQNVNLQVFLSLAQSMLEKPRKISPFGNCWYVIPKVNVPLI
jgi:hypothetical protein